MGGGRGGGPVSLDPQAILDMAGFDTARKEGDSFVVVVTRELTMGRAGRRSFDLLHQP